MQVNATFLEETLACCGVDMGLPWKPVSDRFWSERGVSAEQLAALRATLLEPVQPQYTHV
jgi:hypothetical protein